MKCVYFVQLFSRSMGCKCTLIKPRRLQPNLDCAWNYSQPCLGFWFLRDNCFQTCNWSVVFNTDLSLVNTDKFQSCWGQKSFRFEKDDITNRRSWENFDFWPITAFRNQIFIYRKPQVANRLSHHQSQTIKTMKDATYKI